MNLEQRRQELVKELENARTQLTSVQQRKTELENAEQRLIGAVLLLDELLRDEAEPAAVE